MKLKWLGLDWDIQPIVVFLYSFWTTASLSWGLGGLFGMPHALETDNNTFVVIYCVNWISIAIIIATYESATDKIFKI